MTRALTVWWEGTVVGSLALDPDGQMQFTYAAEWLAGERSPALSCSLPKRREPFRRRLCRPFFEGLLPEGAQRDAVARVLGVSPDNEFGLLEGLGGDVAGALTLWPEGEDAAAPRGRGSDGGAVRRGFGRSFGIASRPPLPCRRW